MRFVVPIDADGTLRRHDKALLAAEILVTYVAVRLRLRRDNLVDALAHLRDAKPAAAGPRPAPDSPRLTGVRLGHIVQKTLAVLPTDSRCLMRSLVLTRVLARRDIDTSLVIGVRTEPEFGAHAWVEYEGDPLLPALDVRDRRLLEA